MRYSKPEINIEMFLSEDILTTSSAGGQNAGSNAADATAAMRAINADTKIANVVYDTLFN